jgi:hypothetical protein
MSEPIVEEKTLIARAAMPARGGSNWAASEAWAIR